jgi:molecular chaperone DnaJ
VGDDIHSTEWITISQAALGANRIIDTVWGKKEVKVPEGSQDGSNLILKGDVIINLSKGVHLLKNKGNHVILLRVKIPTKLNDKQRKIFQ